jgi:hypothetical protein
MADITTPQEVKYLEEHGGPSAEGAKAMQTSFEKCARTAAE